MKTKPVSKVFFHLLDIPSGFENLLFTLAWNIFFNFVAESGSSFFKIIKIPLVCHRPDLLAADFFELLNRQFAEWLLKSTMTANTIGFITSVS